MSLIGLLLKSGMDWQLLEALGMALFAIGLIMGLIRIIPNLRSLIGSRSLLLGSAFGNTGYFGIPVSLALLPAESLSFSIGYDIGATLFVWSLGPILLARPSFALKELRAGRTLFYVFASSPATKGLLGAMLLQLTPWSSQITSFLWFPSRIVIALALIVVGIRLASLGPARNPNRSNHRGIQTTLLIKLIILPVLMLLLAKAFSVPILMRNALVLQAATPTALSVLLLAEASEKEQEIAGSIVAWSTMAATVTIPTWLLILQRLA